jgi:type IV secretion system protein VirB10
VTGLIDASNMPGLRRLNRLPIVLIIGLLVLVIATIVFGLASRGLWDRGSTDDGAGNGGPASDFAETLKRGVSDAIIGEPEPVTPKPLPVMPPPEVIEAPRIGPADDVANRGSRVPEPAILREAEDWRARLQRDHEEQILNERHRQVMARIQRADGAKAAPLRISLDDLEERLSAGTNNEPGTGSQDRRAPQDRLSERLMAAAEAAQGRAPGEADPNGQGQKQAFLTAGQSEQSMRAESQISPRRLQRGSVIPAILLTGINADLPGGILAQVSRDVHDSVTGRHLLIPQGSRLLGRYDSKVTFGQSRALVVWTDIMLPDGKSLDIGSMAGIDASGQAGFSDKVDRHLLRSFGSAALIASFGAGIGLALPNDPATGIGDAARRSFSETFGRLAERTISKNLDVQPTLKIRPGYRFNILVDRDLVFD